MLLSFSTREICIHQVAYRLPLRCILHVACADLHLTDSERRARRVPKFSSATLLSMYNVSFYHKNDFSFIDGTKRVHTYTSTWSRSQMLPDHACAHTWTYKRRYAGPHCTTRTCSSASLDAAHPPCRKQQQSCSASRARRLPVFHTHTPQKRQRSCIDSDGRRRRCRPQLPVPGGSSKHWHLRKCPAHMGTSGGALVVRSATANCTRERQPSTH